MLPVTTAPTARASASRREPVSDADVHNALPNRDHLRKYLPSKWHLPYEQLPGRLLSGRFYMTRAQPGIYRADVWPPTGQTPGSDLDFLRKQLLDEWNIDHAVVSPLDGLRWPQHGELGAALAAALNDWSAEEWLDADPRLYGSIVIPTEDGQRAAAEVRRLGGERRFVQVFMLARSREPLGHPNYWPIYEAATEHGLPVTVHVGGALNPITGAGWPSYAYEQHVAFVQAYQAQIISLIHSAVFDRFPSLQIVFEEGGFAWVPALMWRLDRAWRLMREQVPHLRVPPSEVIREHFWFTTQPMDEADDPEHFMQMLRHLDMDGRIVFATDYPHWDFDAPDRALPRTVQGTLRDGIMRGNAASLFRFGA
jgi:predicted TIM-barrel fold metal-dependent hydrolase